MRSNKIVLFALSVLVLASMFCSAGDLIPQGAEATLQALTQQVPALQTEVAKQLTLAAPSATPTSNVQATDTVTPGGTDNIPTNTPPGGQSGSITGQLSFPASGLPAMAIVAYHVGGAPNDYHYVTTAQGQGTYQIDNLPVTSYYVVAYSLGGGGFTAGLAGGYSQAVPCGLSVDCTDHSLIAIQVNAGQATSGIDPGDWYAPEGTFPAYPLP